MGLICAFKRSEVQMIKNLDKCFQFFCVINLHHHLLDKSTSVGVSFVS
jgi:hypothetical protein